MSEQRQDGSGETRPQPPSARQIVRRFWPWLQRDRRLVAVVLLASLAVPALEAGSIWVFKTAVDRLLVPQDLGFFPWVAAAYGGLTVVGFLIGLVSGYLATWVSERFLLSLRTDVFRHTQALSVDYLSRRRLGDLLSSLTSDVSSIEEFLFSGFFDALVQAVRMPVFVVFLLAIDWHLALIALVVAPAYWLTAHWFSGRQQVLSRERRQRSGLASSIAEETLSNVTLVRAFNGEAAQTERYTREGLAVQALRMKSARLRMVAALVSDLLETTGVLLVLWFGVRQMAAGSLTLGGLVAFLTYLTRVYSPLKGLSSFAGNAASAAAGAERLFELLDRSPEPAVKIGARQLAAARGAITFEHVAFRYPGARSDTLTDISFSVETGEILAIVGPSGAGKSTLLRLLLRFHDPTAGRILLDGHDLRALDLSSLRNAVGVLLQEPFLFHASVRDNVAFGRPDADEASVREAARLAGAHDFAVAQSEGYATLLGQKGARLSGGQRQRVALARAFLREAPVLVLDEPTTGLDAETAEHILTSLRAFGAGRTLIVLTHDARAIAWASRVLVLEDGRMTSPVGGQRRVS